MSDSAKVRVKLKECKGFYAKLVQDCLICRICDQPMLIGHTKPCERQRAIEHWNRQALFYGSVG